MTGKSLSEVRADMLADPWGTEVDLDTPLAGVEAAVEKAKDGLWEAVRREVAKQTTNGMIELVKALKDPQGYLLLPNGEIQLKTLGDSELVTPFYGVCIANLRRVTKEAAFNEVAIVSDRYLIDLAAFLEKLAADVRKWADDPRRNPMREECGEPLK